jgi:hypothetical protein
MSTHPLFGLRVKLGAAHSCGGNLAVISERCGSHYAELRCAACNAHRGWLSHSTASWLHSVINKFGAPTTPIVLRRPPSSSVHWHGKTAG